MKSEASWREAERRWRAKPEDPRLLEGLLEAMRAAKVPIPGELRFRELFAPRAFASELKLLVWVEDRRGKLTHLGETPANEPIAIPTHRTWWVTHAYVGPRGKRTSFARLLDEVEQQEIPGFVVEDGALGEAELAQLEERGKRLKLFGVADKFGASLTPRGLATIGALPSLERLRLSCRFPTLARIHGLSSMTQLLELALAIDGLSGESFADLPASLVRLSARGCRETDVGAEHLTRVEELRELDLAESDLSDAGFKQFAEHVDLGRFEALDLGSCPRITGETVKLLGRAASLVRLGLGRASIDDRALETLPLVESLEDLSLDGCRWVTDRGLEHVAACAHLRELNLDHCSAVTLRGLEKLAACTKLERVYVRGTKAAGVTHADDREKLRAFLPGCEIVAR